MSEQQKQKERKNLYEQYSLKLRQIWQEYRHYDDAVKNIINDMVSILAEENPGVTVRKIAIKIAEDHESLKGFSVATVYRSLDEVNRGMIQKTGRPKSTSTGVSHLRNSNNNNIDPEIEAEAQELKKLIEENQDKEPVMVQGMILQQEKIERLIKDLDKMTNDRDFWKGRYNEIAKPKVVRYEEKYLVIDPVGEGQIAAIFDHDPSLKEINIITGGGE